MKFPREIIVGEGALEEVSRVCSELKLGRSCLMITGKSTYRIAGKRLCRALGERFEVKVERVRLADQDSVEAVAGLAEKLGAEFLLGVGGGKCIDVAKLASKLANVEFVSVPTSVSHDGMASARASILDNGNTVSKEASTPIGVVVDTGIIRASPYRLTASGCGDVVSKLSAVRDWELAHEVKGEDVDPYSLAISRATAEAIIHAREEVPLGTQAALKHVARALVSSGMAMNIHGSSRPGSGSEHKFSHALDAIVEKPALHGEQCGVGSILTMYLHNGDWRLIKSTLEVIGAPTTARELGMDEELVVEALLRAREIRPQRYTILEHLDLGREKAEEAATATGVVE